MSTPQEERMRVLFGPPEEHALLLGLRAGQLGALLAGVAVAAWVFSARPDPVGLVAVAGAISAGVTVAFARIEGRTTDEWLPILTAAAVRRLRAGWRHTATTPTDGAAVRGVRPCPPPVLGGVRILDLASVDGGPVGVVVDRAAGTFTGVAEVTGASLYLAGRDEVERRMAGWGRVLQAVARAGTTIHRLQWLVTAEPDDGTAVWSYLDLHADPTAPTALTASYRSLLEDASPVTQRHRVHLAVTICAASPATRRAIRHAGGGDPGGAAVLGRTVARLREQMAAAELDLGPLLPQTAVAELVRTAYVPGLRTQLATRTRSTSISGLCEQAAWPLAMQTRPRELEADGWWHRVVWVADWPRRPVPLEFLAYLIGGTTCRRAIAVTFAPIDPTRAARQVEQATVQRLADEQLRAERGFRQTARRARDADALARREQELADGHADYRYSAYLRVSAPTLQQLENAVEEVTQAANMSGLIVATLTGQQDLGFAATLPVGRGVR